MVSSKSSYLFVGSDTYLLERAMRDLASSLVKGAAKELDCEVFYGDEADSRQILSHITTIPFLASKRLVIIKDFDKLPREDISRFISYLEKPSASTYLLLETKDDSILKEHGSIASYVNIKRCNPPAGGELVAWVKQFAAHHGKVMEDDAAAYLTDLHGDLSTLAQELENITTFVGKKKAIGLSDVEEVAGRSLAKSAFDLTDAIERKDVDEAMRIASELILTGKRYHEIIGLLSWHLKRLLRAKMHQAKGEGRYLIETILKINKRHADEFFRQLASLSIDEIRSKMRILLEADLDIKRTKFEPALILEFAVIRLCLSR